jgi:glycosyltransferase involved in cell wall biosynthesis
VTAGRQTPYKRIDLAVAACTQLNLPLVVLGSGPDHSRLKKAAGKSVTFLRGKNDEELAHYFQTSLAFIFPGVDDFGIVAVEALAAGTPVIAYEAGGALDYVQPGKNGEFFKEQTAESLASVLSRFNPDSYNNSAVAKTAQTFSPERFHERISKYIKKVTS